jgi:hypothetical protein
VVFYRNALAGLGKDTLEQRGLVEKSMEVVEMQKEGGESDSDDGMDIEPASKRVRV